jgi:hypothetical protein
MPRPGAGFQVDVSVENLDHWVRRIDGADKIVSRETEVSLVAMGSHLRPLVQDKTPVDRGKLKAAIDFRVEKVGKGVYRLDLHAGGVKYAIFVERGTRPHWPPMDAIRGWAERHGIPPFLVARAIARHGTIKRFGRPGPAGAEMFERTLDDEENWIKREQDRLGENIVKGIVSS